MTELSSHRQILRSSSIIGGATLANIFIGLLGTKVAAMLLGPAGIGFIGLLNQLITTAASVAALGFSNVGTRQIAKAKGKDDQTAVAAARRALFWGTLLLAVLGTAVVWALRVPIATRVLDDAGQAKAVGWLALGVGLTVVCGSQTALLTGLRRTGDLARLKVGAAFVSTVLGVAALWAWGERGMVAYVLMAPLTALALGHWYVARLPRIDSPPTPLPQLVAQWCTLARLGAAFMGASLLANLGHLAVRSLLQRELGAEALGQFQAAWILSMTYLGFVLGAMGADYYPRLTATIHDRQATNRLVNEQTEVALLLAGPVLLAMLALAPLVVRLLYSAEFGEAAAILRWQVLGDVLKVASWPLGFVLLAAGAGRTFLLAEGSSIGLFLLLVWLGLPWLGVQATGVAFALMYAFYLPLVHWLARIRTGFAWHAAVRRQLALLVLAALATCLLAHWKEWLAVSIGLAAAVGFGLHALRKLAQMVENDGRFGRLAATVKRYLQE